MYRKCHLCLPVILVFLLAAPTLAQEGSITGRVVAGASTAPLEDVQVTVVGTSLGAVTAADGSYSILNVPAGSYQVQAGRIGYQFVTADITVRAGRPTTVDFQLNRLVLQLDEIVVTGTAGGARRREVGNTISQLNIQDRIETPISVERSLQAAAPGLTVMQSSGQIGSAAQIRLRGNVSVTMSNQPLFYVDGVRIRSEPYRKNVSQASSDNRSQNDVHSPLNEIDPADIERIEIIKGAAATTLYGTEASAGVIQIFTKQGRRGAAVWNFNIDQGFDKEMAFAPEPAPFMYMDPWLRTAWKQRYGMSVRGGGEDLTYYVSGSWDNNEGVLPSDHLEKVSVRGNFTFAPTENLNVEWNTFLTRSEIRNTPTGNNSHGLTLNVFRQERGYLGSSEKVVVDSILDYDIRSYVDHLITGATITYTPIRNFSNRLTVGYDLAENEGRQIRPYGFIRAPQGIMSDVRLRNEIITLDYSGNLNLSLTGSLRSTVSFGGQSVQSDERVLDAYSDHFPGPSDPTVTTGSNRQGFESRMRVINAGFFGQVLFDLKNKYFLTLGLRVDGNSAFGESFGLQPYPKASFSYVLSEEAFWPASLGEIKLRGAYGHSGRAPGAFDAVKTWDPVGWGGEPAYFPRNKGNPDLGPERTAEYELGFEGGILGGRLTYDFTYYHRLTTDALFSVRQIPSTLFQSSRLENVGEISNSGFELTTNIGILNKPNLGWDVGVQISTNHSKVESLGGATAFSVGGNGWIYEGETAPVIVGTKILNPDEIAEPILDQEYHFGPNQPTKIVGLNTTIRLPLSIELHARGEYQGGHFITDGATDGAQQRNVISWPTCIAARQMVTDGRVDELTALERQRCITENWVSRSHIYPADFFKMRELSVRFPVDFLIPGSTSASLSLTANNFFRWRNKDFPIFDPEMMANQGSLAPVRSFNEQIPPPATFTASLRMAF